MTSRRTLLKSAALGSGAAALTSCDRPISQLTAMFGQDVPDKLTVADSAEIDPDFHLLSRAAFGPWPGDLERVKKIGRSAWIEEQLHPEHIDDGLCDLRARRFESLFYSAGNAYEFKKPVLRDELTRHSLLRAIYSKRQLHEVMVEFWTDHLNIDLEKGDCIYFKPSDDRDVIRKHALGNFHDLIRASATSPAMLVYLDGRSNKVTKDKPVPNENYARELLELHTLGVHGGYTQTDVREAARCLSGWTVNLLKGNQGGPAKRLKNGLQGLMKPSRGESFFDADSHDDGEKKVLGITIPAGGGESDLDQLVKIACSHPSTAQFIAKKLCTRFVSYAPPQSIVDRVAAEFTRTGGDIKAMLRVVLTSEEFLTARGTLLKRPFRFMVTALRAMAADTHVHGSPFKHNTGALTEYLARMGHGLFQYPTPDGYPDEEAPWMGTLMWRWNFAFSLTNNKLGDVDVPLNDLEKAIGKHGDRNAIAARWWSHLTGRKPTDLELQSIAAATDAQASKDNTRTAKAELLGIMLAAPGFQRC